MCETQLNCQISHLCYQYLLNNSRNLHTIKNRTENCVFEENTLRLSKKCIWSTEELSS